MKRAKSHGQAHKYAVEKLQEQANIGAYILLTMDSKPPYFATFSRDAKLRDENDNAAPIFRMIMSQYVNLSPAVKEELYAVVDAQRDVEAREKAALEARELEEQELRMEEVEGPAVAAPIKGAPPSVWARIKNIFKRKA